MKRAGRLLSLDILKAVCIFLVIITHCPFSDQQKIALLFSIWVYPAVPVSLTIMGFNFYNSANKIYDSECDLTYEKWYTKKVFIPKFLHFLIPYIIAMGISLIYLLPHKNFTTMCEFLDGEG